MNDFYSNNDFQPSATNPNFETDTLINMNQDMTSKKAKDEMKNMLEQMALDPSFIIQAQDPEVLQELSAILKEGNIISEIDMKNREKRKNNMEKNSFHNQIYNQHFNKMDDTTKQHNKQYKNNRVGE